MNKRLNILLILMVMIAAVAFVEGRYTRSGARATSAVAMMLASMPSDAVQAPQPRPGMILVEFLQGTEQTALQCNPS